MNTKYLVIIAFIATFGIGLLSGYLLFSPTQGGAEITGTEQRDDNRQRFLRQNRGERNIEELRNRIRVELDLTEDQNDPVFQILGKHRQNIRAEMSRNRNEMDSVLSRHESEMMEELAEILTDEQLSTFRENFSRQAYQERRRMRMGN